MKKNKWIYIGQVQIINRFNIIEMIFQNNFLKEYQAIHLCQDMFEDLKA